ncbi:MAG: hypothetical protein NTZ56_16690 [Acidobacteria bacterium]|nr:hypothetical protein [Acidobacteriota bacterium]
MTRGGHAVSRAQFEENLLSKLAMPEFASDLPLILSGEALNGFDAKRAGELVLQRLVARLKGEPWQGTKL